MCEARDPLTQLPCLRQDGHDGEHHAMGYDRGARWSVGWHDPDTIMRAITLELEPEKRSAN